MSLRNHFHATIWVWRTFPGRVARRVYLAIVLLLLLASTAIRVRTFILTRRMEAVISELSKLRIDETTEDEALRTVPYLIRGERDEHVHPSVELGDIQPGIMRFDYITISNQANWERFASFANRFSTVHVTGNLKETSWILTAADLLGYRYFGFYAQVIVFNGRVSRIRYEVSNQMRIPDLEGTVSVSSFHSRWTSHQMGIFVPSIDDESPAYTVGGYDEDLAVRFSPDVAPELRSHAFHVNLSCLWGLFGCRARQIAPLLWDDKNEIETATVARLTSNDPCPDRILSGRARYLPDNSIRLVESTRSATRGVNENGQSVEENVTTYKPIETLRGFPSTSSGSITSEATILYPGDYKRTLPNRGFQWAKAGERLLIFDGFDSCRVVLATPSTLAAVRNAVPAPRRAEDEILLGIQ